MRAMLPRSLLVAVLLAAGCASRGAPAAASAWAPVSPSAWADLQQKLVGRWKATLPGGGTITATYRVISRGSAMVETFVTASGTETITVYHPDGAQLMLTHYCAQGNQSRLKAVEVSPGRAVFRFLDATNVAPAQGVMHALEVTMRGDSFDQRSVYRQPDGGDAADTLHFVREPVTR